MAVNNAQTVPAASSFNYLFFSCRGYTKKAQSFCERKKRVYTQQFIRIVKCANSRSAAGKLLAALIARAPTIARPSAQVPVTSS